MSDHVARALGPFFDAIMALELTPSQMVLGGWKLTTKPKKRGGQGRSWEYEEERGEDWQRPLFDESNTIFSWTETNELVDAIHESTQADLPEIRGVMLDVAASYLRNQSVVDRDELIGLLSAEIMDLFTLGLPARFRSIISGIETAKEISPVDGVLIRPFRPEDWPASLDPTQNLGGPDISQSTVLEFEGRMPVLGQPLDPFDEKFYHWQKKHEQILRVLRLYRVGGVVAHRESTVPTTVLRIPMHGQGGLGPISVSSFKYALSPADEESLRTHFRFLENLPPWKHDNLTSVDIALERYETALAPAKFAEDTMLYAIMGLEALLRSQHEGRQALVNRVALLMDLAEFEDPRTVRKTVNALYLFRNPFVHGETVKRSDVPRLTRLLTPLLDYLRAAILIRMGLKVRKGTLLRWTDDALLLPSERRKLAQRVAMVAEQAQLNSSDEGGGSAGGNARVG